MSCASNQAVLLLSVKVPDGDDIALAIPLETCSYDSVSDAVNSILGRNSGPFEYEDEDGDRITVRGQEDFLAMLGLYVDQLQEADANNSKPAPIVIHPTGGKLKRNIHGLKVETKHQEQSHPIPEPPPHSIESMDITVAHSSSRKQEMGDIRDMITSGGHIKNSDLEYLEILGQGHGGTVYRVCHKPTNRILAIKQIPLDITPVIQKQIIAELEVLHKCKSPSIIDFFGAYFIDNRISICTEYMDGGSLDKYGQIPEPVVRCVAVAALHGLQYLWSLKIMHRDVKPSNILVNSHGHVKLCDFGVSVQLVNSIANTYIGTNIYMAPERIRGHEYGIPSEVWSLGISLLEMSLGRFPFQKLGGPAAQTGHIKLMEQLHCITSEQPVLPSTASYSASFIDFVSHCIMKHPQDRPMPDKLLNHAFIVAQENNNNHLIVSDWLKQAILRKTRLK